MTGPMGATVIVGAQEEVASEKLIGWGGESYRPKDKVSRRFKSARGA
jgi:hypothetical protein